MAFAELLERHAISTPGPAGLVGLEHEYNVYRENTLVDFRALLPRLLTRVESWHGTGEHGAFLDDGSLLCCDGTHAETALPPEGMERGVFERVSGRAMATQERLRALLRDEADRYGLQGYSTHLSAYCRFVDINALCERYARSYAPALMMMIDRPSSPGLLVRPRPRRFEVGGDYLGPGPLLEAAVCVFVATTLACMQDLLCGDDIDLLDDSRLEHPTQRPGWFVARDAFGSDLYTLGRGASLRRADGVDMTAQSLLLAAWRRARPFVEDTAAPAVLARVDAMVAGREALPMERSDGQSIGGSTDVAPGRFAKLFASAVRPIQLKRHRLTPHIMTWDGVVFRVQGDTTFYANVPRRHLPVLEAADELDAVLADFPGGVVDVSPETPTLSEIVDETEFRLSFPQGDDKKKKKKSREFAECMVTLLREDKTLPVVEICIPETRDSLSARKPQEPIINASTLADGVMGHNGGWIRDDVDLQVQAIGFSFSFHRWYRSFVDHDGIMGHRWDHEYNQRMIPSRPPAFRNFDGGWCEVYSGSETSKSGDLRFCDGAGRVTQHAFESWNHRTIRQCVGGRLQTYRAVVTIYARNPGERTVLQRYAVFEGESPWGDPVFYVRRSHDGRQQIFNCHGHLIALRDATRNLMRFEYALPFNPGTRYLTLARISDTSRRQYRLTYASRGGSLRLVGLREIRANARTLTFNYDQTGQLTSVVRPGGTFPLNTVAYDYEGAIGRMVRFFSPELAGGARALVEVTYNAQEQVETQREGGGTHRFAYTGDWVNEHTDRRGVRTRYAFRALNGTFVAEEKAVQSTPLSLPSQVQFAQPQEWLETREYDAEFQITRLQSPRGLVFEITFEPASAPITEGDERDWVEQNLTWTTDLARGNKLREVVTSPRPGEPPRTNAWTYERLFNQVTQLSDPRGTTTFAYDNGSCARPWNNSKPIRIVHPKSGSGPSAADVIETNVWRAGGLIARRTDADGIVSVYTYNIYGICTSETIDPGGVRIQQLWETDDLGRVVQRTDADGGITKTNFDNRDNVATMTDEFGHVITHTYDRNDSLTRVEQEIRDDPANFTIPTAPVATYAIVSVFDDEGRELQRTMDADGLALRTEWDYDGEGNVIVERTPRAVSANPSSPGAIREMEYDARGLLYRIVHARGTADETDDYMLHDPDGNPLAAVNGEREVVTWVHNGFGEMLQERDSVGGVSIYTRNAAGQVIRFIRRGTTGGPSPTDRAGTGNRVLADVALENDAYDRLISVRPAVFDPVRGRSANPPRLESAMVFTPGGRMFEETDPAGRVTVYGYDSAGRPNRTELPGGHQRLFTYTPMGRLTSVTQIDLVEGSPLAGPVPTLQLLSTRTYDKGGRVTSQTLSGQGTTEFAYNSLDWPRAEKRATGAIIISEFDTAGRRTAKEMPSQGGAFNPSAKMRLTWSYDEAGNVVTSSDGLQNTTTWTYDALDRLRSSVSADNTSVVADLDKAGRPVLVTYRGGEQIRMTYDDEGRLTRKQHVNAAAPPALDQTFEMDGMGRVTRMTDNSEGGSTVTRSYNSLSWLVAEDQDGFRVTAGYDLSGRLINLTYPSGRAVQWGLHPSGRASFVNRDQARVADFVWRGDSVVERQVAATLRDPGTGITYPFPLIRRRDYDSSGRLNAFSHVLRDAIVSATNPQLVNLYRFGGLQYDAAGRLIEKQRAGNVEQYTYDLADQLVARRVEPTAQPGLRTLEETSFFDAAGNARRRDRLEVPTRGQRPLVSTLQDYSSTNSITTRRITVGGISAPSEQVSYDQRGGLFQVRYEIPPTTPDGQATPGTRNTFYDALGRHRLAFVDTDVATIPNLRVFNRHDASGRRLVRVEQDVQGPANSVLAERQTRYVFWGDMVLEEYERTGDIDTWQRARTFVHGAEAREVVTIEVPESTPNVDVDGDGRIGGDAVLALLQDHDQSALALCRFSAVGTVYSPIYERYYTDGLGRVDRFRADGRQRTPIADSTIGHVIGQHGQWTHGKEGLVYALHRFRDTGLGTWINPEPGGDWADPRANGNSYPYAGNNPVMANDPNGEELVTLAALAALAVGTYYLAEYTESEFIAAFSPIHDAATAWTGYDAITGREVAAWEQLLATVGAITSFIPIFGAAFGVARVALTSGKTALKSGKAVLRTSRAASRAGANSARDRVRKAITDDVAAIGRYGGSPEALDRIHEVIAEARRLLHQEYDTYLHGVVHGPLTRSNPLLRVKSFESMGSTLGKVSWDDRLREIVTLNSEVIADFADKPAWFAKHVMGHEAQHVVFTLRPGRLQFLRRLTDSNTAIVRAIPRWIDESIAYGVSHGGRFRPWRALDSLPTQDLCLLGSGAIRGLGIAERLILRRVMGDDR